MQPTLRATKYLRCISFKYLLFILCYGIVFTSSVSAQTVNQDDSFEVYLDFRHQGVINSVITTYYKDDLFYLPVSELFSLFQIDKEVNGLTIFGNFLTNQIPYEFNFQNNTITFDGEKYPITADDYIVTELDFFIKRTVFSEIFGLEFYIDFNNLAINLENIDGLPVVEKARRNQRRRISDDELTTEDRYDLRFGRNRNFFDLGFLDYNLSYSRANDNNIFVYNANVGSQLVGGDLQGSLFGNVTSESSNFSTNNLRWRYLIRDNSIISNLTIGQTSTTGITKNAYTGVRISNNPIENRRLFDKFEIKGNTIPQSEVELYLNNSLVDFQQSDALGNYRFLAPINYGTSQLDLKIYGPTGQVIDRSNRIQIPFNFQPAKTFNYSLNAGKLDFPLIGTTDRSNTLQLNGAYGINKSVTVKSGVEYYDQFHTSLPTFTTSISTRFNSSNILMLEAASDAFYRVVYNNIFTNSTSINIDYTNFITGLGVYNQSGDTQRLISSLFFPINFERVPLNIRFSTFTGFRDNGSSTSFRADGNARIGKINLRLAYSDRYFNNFNILDPSSLSNIQSSVTYNISRRRSIPAYLRGVFLRAQMRYAPKRNEIESAEFLVSQNVFNRGRAQFSVSKNFINDALAFQFRFVVDFNKVRSNTSVNSFDGNYSYTQNLRGSIGYDTNYNQFLFTSRDQVGRSASAVKLFVDNNNNGKFDKEIDNTINDKAIRFNRTGASVIEKNGILYVTQMQPYYYYNMEVNKGAIKNPTIIPNFEKFGVITDPNTFKKIEIPFYTSGVIEGVVERLFSNDLKSGIGGLKLNLASLTDGKDYTKELRTFSDGSFYTYEIPPGNYELTIDPEQLNILDASASPGKIEFEVKSLAQGDFVEGLNFLLTPKNGETQVEETVPIETIIADISQNNEVLEYETQLNENVDITLRLIVQAQTAFYNRNIDRALALVNESLAIFETAQGYALKGSLNYLMGNRIEAQKSWEKATQFNPNIFIPDIEALDQIIRTEIGD